MSYLKVSPPYGQVDGPPLSTFCRDLEEAKDVIDTQIEYIASLHREIIVLRKELKKYTKKYILTEARNIKIEEKPKREA